MRGMRRNVEVDKKMLKLAESAEHCQEATPHFPTHSKVKTQQVEK